jgi:eukaryotic-like serine/threonine-protein kinase
MIGTVVAGKYRLDQELGAGTMGVVYRARQLDLDRDVAIKVLRSGQASRPEARLRFMREAKVASKLAHPAAVQILDFGEFESQYYLVMEFLQGENLRERMHRGPLSVEEIVKVSREVASALVAAHNVRLTHRDIKPENIYLQRVEGEGETQDSGHWRVRVVDFGLAFVADSDDHTVSRMTQEGIVGGSPAYMSPEQVHGKSIGPASDIYGLGCVMFELLAGQPLFSGSLGDVLTHQAYSAPPPVSSVNARCTASVALLALLTKMLAKTAPLRPSPKHVVAALTAELESLDSQIAAAQSKTEALSARSVRALARRASIPPLTVGLIPDGTAHVFVIAPVDSALEIALVSAGAIIVPFSNCRELVAADVGSQSSGNKPSSSAKLSQVIWAPNIDASTLSQLVSTGISVVTDLPAPTFERIMECLRAGAADVVTNNAPEQIARSLLRLISRINPDAGAA